MKYGRYEIQKELGKGAMGVVYQAHDPEIDRRVALKVLRPDRVTSEDFLQRFLKEAKAIGRLSHPHIVTVYDVGRDHDTVYIAMEFLEGRPLDEIFKGNPLRLEEIIHIGIQVAAALDYGHSQGIVHRDIKPSNIMLAPNGDIKITDFGIAHIEDTAAPQLTQAGEILGTPVYMSPEQVKGQPVDGRSDLYSLGVILYEMSTGRRPFSGNNLAAIFHAITGEEPAEPIAAEPFVACGASRALSDLILKCLNKDPGKRFQSGQSMVEALSACLSTDSGTKSVNQPLSRKTAKRRAFAIAAVCTLIVAAGLIWFLSGHTPLVTPPAPISRPRTPLPVLNISSNPDGAQVYLDGSFKGNTPLKIDLPVGKYEVRVSLPDYHEYEAQVQLRDTGEMPVFARLIPKE
ncbi:MAG: serine/threonine-protein kinase [Desulfobacterales bacterium]|jgi:serine/threonine protein kinase|nr:serine/threonine-protein kinase [Desulfobacterales bacterium]